MKRILSYLVLTLGVLCAIPVAVVLFDLASLHYSILILAHILTAILGTAGFYLLTTEKTGGIKGENVWWILTSTLCITIPFWGIVSALVIYTTQKLIKKRPAPIVNNEITVPGPGVFKRPMSRIRQSEILERIDIEPFIDIFRTGRPELKKSAIKLLGTMRSKAAIRALGKALLDRDIEVRLFASGVINLIDDNFAERIEEKKKKYDDNPKNSRAATDLAALYLAYADSGLLDRIQNTYYYHWVIKLLAELPVDAEICYLMARAFYELEEYNKVQECIDICLVSDPLNPDYNEMHCKNLFAKKQYEALYPKIQMMKEQNIEPKDKEPIEFWT